MYAQAEAAGEDEGPGEDLTADSPGGGSGGGGGDGAAGEKAAAKKGKG